MDPAEISIGAVIALIIIVPIWLMRRSAKRSGNPEHRIW